MKPTTLYLGDTLITKDEAWAGNDGTHAIRPAIFLWDNGNGTATIMKTSTAGPRQGRKPRANDRRLSPDGRGRGNSLTKSCDAIGDRYGICSMPWSCIQRKMGELSDADYDWLNDRLDALGL